MCDVCCVMVCVGALLIDENTPVRLDNERKTNNSESDRVVEVISKFVSDRMVIVQQKAEAMSERIRKKEEEEGERYSRRKSLRRSLSVSRARSNNVYVSPHVKLKLCESVACLGTSDRVKAFQIFSDETGTKGRTIRGWCGFAGRFSGGGIAELPVA